MSSIQLEPNAAPITKDQYPKATAYIQNDAPGYQLDFYQIDAVQDPSMTLDNCQVYGIPSMAIQFCLKSANNSFLAGI
jgi:hypothetical protein